MGTAAGPPGHRVPRTAYRVVMRFLLRPGWLALIVAVVGFAVACYTFLAPWQFGREAERDSQQHAIDVAAGTPPVPFTTLVAGPAVPADVEWRQVSVTGTFLPEAETLVRLRVVDGKPATEVMTPLRTADGRVVVVDRGSVATSGTEIPDFTPAPAGEVTVTGRLRLDETDPQHRAAFTEAGRRQMYAADSRTIAAATGLPVVAGYVAQTGGPGLLTPLQIVPDTGGAPFSNLSYALQWLTFGAIALVALGYFVRLELLQRGGRRDRGADRAALRDALAGRDDPTPEDQAPVPPTEAGAPAGDGPDSAGPAPRGRAEPTELTERPRT